MREASLQPWRTARCIPTLVPQSLRLPACTHGHKMIMQCNFPSIPADATTLSMACLQPRASKPWCGGLRTKLHRYLGIGCFQPHFLLDTCISTPCCLISVSLRSCSELLRKGSALISSSQIIATVTPHPTFSYTKLRPQVQADGLHALQPYLIKSTRRHLLTISIPFPQHPNPCRLSLHSHLRPHRSTKPSQTFKPAY